LKAIIFALGVLLPGVAAAQMFKCTDATGKVTYAGRKCSDLGLKDAGEVPERINVSPAYRPPAGYRPPPPAAQPAPAQPAQNPPAAETEEKDPNRRCFSVAAGKGKTITRCNDKPDEDAPAESSR